MAAWESLNETLSRSADGDDIDDGSSLLDSVATPATSWRTPVPTTTSASSISSRTPTPTPDLDDMGALVNSLLDGSTRDDLNEALLGMINGEAGSSIDKYLESTKSSSGLSPGAIVGIVLGCVAFVALFAAFVFQRRRQQQQQQNATTTAFASHEPGQVSFIGAYSPSGSTKIPNGSSNIRKSNAGTAITTATNSSNHSLADNLTTMSAKSDAPILALAGSASGPPLWEDETIVTVRLPREKVVSTTLISRGGYGEVYLGVYNGQQVAIKTLLSETKKNLKQINAFLSEVKLMAGLEHERVVQFIGVAWDSLTDLCVVTEYMEGGDLRAVLARFEEKEHRPKGFDNDKIRIALHIAHALTYLHSLQPQVLHRDLKSKNILLDSELNAKLTDFGVSRERGDATMTANVGTSLWMAPEVMVGDRYGPQADIFSFGVVLSELDSHQLPYSETRETPSGHRIPDAAVLQMVAMGRLQVQFSPDAVPEMVALATACVALDPETRPTAAEVLYKLHVLLRDRNGGFV